LADEIAGLVTEKLSENILGLDVNLMTLLVLHA
jgi:hypothetical protein